MSSSNLSTDFGDLIAARIRSSHREIAERWLLRLKALLPVGTNEIFPSHDILDHIPALITEVANHVGSAATEPPIANTVIFSKARELGELRFAQKASVHQLLREYHLLAEVLGTFVHEQFEDLGVTSSLTAATAIVNRLNDAVFILLQTTVDTFIGRYTDTIEDHTARLEGFNRMVSHELRQPLSTIQYAVALLGSPAADDEAERRRYLDTAARNVKRLSQLLGMLSMLVQTEQDNPQLQEVDLSQITGEVIRQLEDAAQAKGVELRCAAPPVAVTADVSRLEILLVNLVSNAIKYRDPAKASFVDVGVEPGDDRCTIRVADNGLGIPAQDHAKVFRRFYRAHAVRDRELGNDGAGLGLAIAAECARAMGASLEFESAEGHGTTFVVRLPIKNGRS